MSGRETAGDHVIGGGRRANYTALLLFLAGAVLGMVAVYLQLNHGHYVPFLVGGLLCSLAAILAFALGKDEHED